MKKNDNDSVGGKPSASVYLQRTGEGSSPSPLKVLLVVYVFSYLHFGILKEKKVIISRNCLPFEAELNLANLSSVLRKSFRMVNGALEYLETNLGIAENTVLQGNLVGVEDGRPLIAKKFNLQEKIAAAVCPLRLELGIGKRANFELLEKLGLIGGVFMIGTLIMMRKQLRLRLEPAEEPEGLEELEQLYWSARMRIIMRTAYYLQDMHGLNPLVALCLLNSKAISLTDDEFDQKPFFVTSGPNVIVSEYHIFYMTKHNQESTPMLPPNGIGSNVGYNQLEGTSFDLMAKELVTMICPI
ncbi:hypothetical protein ACH5RR_003242 [Cinchona calisaya]|uniref:Uncharacterized protein n=1 Tax=Cinchona calisaya TaxID=153742 RepID=A0ABD3AUA0_9GENT